MSEQERFERERNKQDVEAHRFRETEEPTDDERDAVRSEDEGDDVEAHKLTPRNKQ